jgi:hypothetical protein
MEILNMDYNKKMLIIKALNSSRTNKIASVKLGVSEKSLYSYTRQYNIKYNKNTQNYEEDVPRGSITIEV